MIVHPSKHQRSGRGKQQFEHYKVLGIIWIECMIVLRSNGSETLDYIITIIPLTIIPLTLPQIQLQCYYIAFEEIRKYTQLK
jgi:hypothetical protein